jgi:hypothetical protein
MSISFTSRLLERCCALLLLLARRKTSSWCSHSGTCLKTEERVDTQKQKYLFLISSVVKDSS